jgi:hypothetical protein
MRAPGVHSELHYRLEGIEPVAPRVERALQAGPFLLLAAAAVALASPATRPAARWVFGEENGPAELLTFAFLFLGGFRGLSLAVRARQLQLGGVAAFNFAFAAGLLLVGMEEIAWGQWFFHWDTPDYWLAINKQGETTLHNLAATHGSTEMFRIIFAVGGLVGIWCARIPALAAVSTPPVLGPLFLLVAVHASGDLLLDYAAPASLLEKAFTSTSELVEMYAALAGWMYLVLSSRRLERSYASRATQRASP